MLTLYPPTLPDNTSLLPNPHVPVLLNEVIQGLQIRPGGVYIDGTVGAGGHSAAIISRAEGGRLLDLDTDPTALELAAERLQPYIERGQVRLVRANLQQLEETARAEGFDQVDGVVFDLGGASMQLD